MAEMFDVEMFDDTHALIDIVGVSGDVVLTLDANTDMPVREFKERLIQEMQFERFTVVDLLLDDTPLPHELLLRDGGIMPGERYQLALICQQHFVFDELKKGDGVEIKGLDRVQNTVTDSWGCRPNKCRMVLGRTPFPNGQVNHFRVRLEKGPWYYIGIADLDVNLNTWLGSDGKSRSYYLKDGRDGSRFGPGYRNGGPPMKEGDTATFTIDTIAGTLHVAKNYDAPMLNARGLMEKEEVYMALGMGANGTTLVLEEAWRSK